MPFIGKLDFPDIVVENGIHLERADHSSIVPGSKPLEKLLPPHREQYTIEAESKQDFCKTNAFSCKINSWDAYNLLEPGTSPRNAAVLCVFGFHDCIFFGLPL